MRRDREDGREASGTRALAGSYTVEASLLFSVVLLILVAILSTTEYLTDCGRMMAILAERAVALASGQEAQAEAGGFFRLHGEQIREDNGENRVEVSCRDVPDSARFGEEFRSSFTVKKRRPVSWIRRIRLLQALIE